MIVKQGYYDNYLSKCRASGHTPFTIGMAHVMQDLICSQQRVGQIIMEALPKCILKKRIFNLSIDLAPMVFDRCEGHCL